MIKKNYLTLSPNPIALPRNTFSPRPPVLIVGMHNSGTSILAEIIHKSGIFLCPDMAHYECRFFSHLVNDDLMLGSQERWADIPIMPVDDVLAKEEDYGEFIKKYWIADYVKSGYDGKGPWGLKDPRLCIFLPLYLRLFPDAKVVLIRRDQNDVAASLTRRPKTGLGIKTDIEFWKKLTKSYMERADKYVPKFKNHHVLTYEELCTKPDKVIGPLMEFLNLPPENATSEILRKLTPKRIGSHKRYLTEGPCGKLRRRITSRIYTVVNHVFSKP